MIKRGVAACLLGAIAVFGGCTQPKDDGYAGIENDEFAQDQYVLQQKYIIDSDALAATWESDVDSWVALQTGEICDTLDHGASGDELIQLFAETYGQIVTDPEAFVTRAVDYGCPGSLG